MGLDGSSWIALPTSASLYLPEAERWEPAETGWMQPAVGKEGPATRMVASEWRLHDATGASRVCRVSDVAWRVLEVPWSLCRSRGTNPGRPACSRAPHAPRVSFGRSPNRHSTTPGRFDDESEVTASALARVLVGVTSSDVYRSARRASVRRLEDVGKQLDEATLVSRVTMSDGRNLFGVDSRLRSSDRGLECNTTDVNTRILGLASEQGEAVIDYREVMTEPMAVLDVAPVGLAVVERDWTGGLALRGNASEPICEVPVAYCASPCGGARDALPRVLLGTAVC